jgi:hypothetical protein
MKHSGFGIASFIIAIGAAILHFVVLGVATVLDATTPGGLGDDSPELMLVGLGTIVGLFADFVGVGLGIAGICQRRRSKVFAVLGVVICTVEFVGVVSLMVIGMLVS